MADPTDITHSRPDSAPAPSSVTVAPAPSVSSDEPPPHQPFVPDAANMPEFTWSAVLVGAVLGIVFGASSLYLVLKVGMTVSASIPVAVLSITLFRVFSKVFGIRRATILENNIVQTAGSAGESIAFGVGVTMPALMLLGFEMDIGRVMVVSRPRRPARHPDDDPAAAGVHRQAARQAEIPRRHRLRRSADRRREGRRHAPRRCSSASASRSCTSSSAHGLASCGKDVAGEPPLTLVQGGHCRPSRSIPDAAGRRLHHRHRAFRCIMVAGGVLASFVLIPAIRLFGDGLTEPLYPGRRSSSAT